MKEDNNLMSKFKAGDTESFEKLIIKHRAGAVAFAKRYVHDSHLAEDIAQESFASVYVYRDRYKDNYSFKTYLYTIIKNKSVDYLRKNKYVRYADIKTYEPSNPEQVVLDAENKSLIKRMINQLKDDYRTVLEWEKFDVIMKRIKNEGLNISVTYDRFIEITRELDRILGGSTNYSDAYRLTLLQRPMTYEEAMEDFNSILKDDKLTNAYGRLFADYMGITAGFFPVFLAAFLFTRDRRSKMHELINSRRVSSLTYVLSKYTGLCTALILVYLVFATHATVVFKIIASLNNYPIELFAFYKYTLFFVIPTLIFAVSAGVFISTVFGNGIIAVPVQLILWVISMLPLRGDYSLTKSIIRYNMLGSYDLYTDWLPAIQTNRLFYTIISLVLVFVTSWIWSLKRRAGDGFIRRIFEYRKVQC